MFLRNHLHASGGSREDHFGVGYDVALLVSRFAVNGFEIDAEALLRDRRAFDHALDAAVGDKLNIGAFECGNDRRGEPDNAGGSEHGNLGSFPVAIEFLFQLAFDAGDHRCGGCE